ncbi:MAG TPA: glycosyltransferase family 2 protein [Alphaproteobacteria bacterium]|nr:glycosyltransferase family 2 protein [Alphaproteobacteria bacterium]
MNSKIAVSVVVPLYNEQDNVQRLVERIAAVMRPLKLKWELVAVDDGSRDKTTTVLAKLAREYPELQPVYFRRNYGQTAAMQAGFDMARGEVIVTMDGDLQNDPADIPRLLEHMEKTGVDVVSGWRHKRKDNALWRTFPSRIANRLISNVTGVHLHDYGCSLKAYRREAVAEVRLYGELHRFIPAIAAQYGAKVDELPVNHYAREFGASKYGIDRTFRVVLDLIQVYFFMRYLRRPLHAFGYVGLFCLVPGGLLGTYLLALKLMGESIGGRPLLLLSVVLVLMGVQLIGMGVLGELLVRIYHEPEGRKPYTLK